ncbi:filamin-A-interacting protein 1-like [Clinocottus analis]|uniref:filamin-A-interacting protein 1-like n=1 Tax=Clinocottus analis TaxID=304258 RepID=UPI0035C0B7F9
MRSRSCTTETGPDGGRVRPAGGFVQQEENKPELKRKMKVQREEKDSRAANPQRPAETGKPAAADLTKADMLHLLGIMEGEVQAREDIIGLLKSNRTGPEGLGALGALGARYGWAGPVRALQRDGPLTPRPRGMDHAYENPMAELDRLEDQQKETYRRMLEQLLMAERCHRRTVSELDSEKQKHADFMDKSDDFTELLEQERERLKRLLEQEKAYQARKDKDHSRRLEKVRAELVKLKSFALMLVDERQLHIEQIDRQSQKVQDLARKLQEKEQRLAAVASAAKEDGQKVLVLEAELEHRASRSAQEHEETTAKLADEESQSRQLRLKLAGLEHKIEELEESNKALQKSEEDLQDLREKIGKGECRDSSLVTELENLRRRVLEMEGKDEEITKAETQCRELKRKLQGEDNHSKELRLELDKLQKRMVALEKLEEAFGRSKAECSQLHTNLEKEKGVVKELAGELETMKTRLKELECSETKFEKAEMVFKDDLIKLKSFTVVLVDERKNAVERLRQEEQKSDGLSRMFKAEQGKVTDVTEKLIEESKKLLRFKSETEARVTTLVKEKDELKTKLVNEEEKCRKLNAKLGGMKIRIDGLEQTERELQRKWSDKDNNPDEDNKVKEFALEIERLKSRLKQLEVVEGDLMKTEDEYDLLEKKFRTEQDKANTLSKQLEEIKSQIARNKAIEKGEFASPEAELRIRCKAEEAKTRELQADVQALKEKIHELLNKEDQLSQLQADYSILQQRFVREEEKKTSMSHDFLNLTEELEATRRYSRALRPGANGKRMLSVSVASTAAQTDAAAAEDETATTTAGFIRRSVLEENHLMSNLRQRELKKPAVLERYAPASAELGAKKSWMPWMRRKEAVALAQAGRAPSFPPPGRPLHIRVTPDHETSTATLEITSPRAEDFFSSATVIPTLGLRRPRITIVPESTAAAASKSGAHEPAGGLDRAKSPVTITAISRARSPDEPGGRCSDGFRSPVSVITVSGSGSGSGSGGSPEPRDIAASRTVITVNPEKRPTAFGKYNGNVITTGDNKIHIHLGPQLKRPCEPPGAPPGAPPCEPPCEPPRGATLTLRGSGCGGEAATGTVLRSPRCSPGKTAMTGKMTSSITITPISSPSARPTQPVPGPVQSARSAASRIPAPKGTAPSGSKAAVSTVTRLESRAESRSVKIELRRSTAAEGEEPNMQTQRGCFI